MKFEVFYWLAALAVPALLSLILKGQGKRRAQDALLLMTTVMAIYFVAAMLTSPNRLGKARATVGADPAQLSLRLAVALQSVKESAEQDVSKALGIGAKKSPPADDDYIQPAYDQAESSLRKVLTRDAADQRTRLKLAIVLGSQEQASKDTESAVLLSEIRRSDDKTTARLAQVVEYIYIKKQKPPGSTDENVELIKNELRPGWYRDELLTGLYSVSKDQKALQAHLEEVQEKGLKFFGGLIALATVAVAAGLTGLIVIVVQFAVTARRAQETNTVGLDLPWRTIYTVFLSWFGIQVLMSFLVHELTKHVTFGKDPLSVSLMTAFTYALANLPGIFFVYFVALRPRGLNFFKSLAVRSKTETAGPVKLAVAGYLGWCAAIPLVLTAGAISHLVLQSQGSENPVIGQIVSAASSPNIFATIIFFLTLGVLAPICEEIIFRGFLYSSLRPKIGAAMAMFSSALLFSFLHFDRGGILPLFCIGFVLAFVLEKTRSLVPCIITHGLWNSGTFAAVLILYGGQ